MKNSMLWMAAVVTALLMAACKGTPDPYSDYDAYHIQPFNSSDQRDVWWADYLTGNMQRRTIGPQMIFSDTPPKDRHKVLKVKIDLDTAAAFDYAVERGGDHLTLRANSRRNLAWLLNQFVSMAGATDPRGDVTDLPPAYVDFERSHSGNFSFEYRSIYSHTNANPQKRGYLNADHANDAGLLRLELKTLFPEGLPDTVRAKLPGGAISQRQLCMSADGLFDIYEKWIVGHWGEGAPGRGQRFSVAPMNVREVCTCGACIEAGNTPTSATPATVKLVRRLCERFPNHRFYLQAFNTTLSAPKQPLPDNAGVFVAAMDVPMSLNFPDSRQYKELKETVSRWKKMTPNIYVWDYMRNFDDFLTPYPLLKIMQKRLFRYKKLGIKGVFLYGSGDTYSMLDDLHSYALAALLIDTDQNVDTLTSRFFHRFYPTTAPLLTAVYTNIENIACSGGPLPTHGGLTQGIQKYFDDQDNRHFMAGIDSLMRITKARHDEIPRLRRLLMALTFTQLEYERLPGHKFDRQWIDQRLDILSHHSEVPGMTGYREKYGDIDQYIQQWRNTPNWKADPSLLRKQPVKALQPLIEEFRDPSVLTDGHRGFATDRYNGWLHHTSDSLTLELTAPTPGSEIVVGLLRAPLWTVGLPSVIELWQDHRKLSEVRPVPPSTPVATSLAPNAPDVMPGVRVEVRLDAHALKPGRPFRLKLRRGVQKRFALDEISLLP